MCAVKVAAYTESARLAPADPDEFKARVRRRIETLERRRRWRRTLVTGAVVTALLGGVVFFGRSRSGPATNLAAGAGNNSSSAALQPLKGPPVGIAKLLPGGSGYVTTARGLLYTPDFGKTWSQDAWPPGLESAGAETMHFAPDGHVWIAGVTDATQPTPEGDVTYTISTFRRDHPQAAWTKTSSFPINASSFWPPSPMSLSFIDSSTGWMMVSTKSGMALARGELFQTTDGGRTWTQLTTEETTPISGEIFFSSPTVGYIAGGSACCVLYATTDGGRTWAQPNLPMPAAKAKERFEALGPPARAADAVVFAGQWRGSGATPDDVGIFRSTDGGATWTVAALPTLSPDESYSFIDVPGANHFMLLHLSPTRDVVSHSRDGGQSFDNRDDKTATPIAALSSVSAADEQHLWAVGTEGHCRSFKSDCSSSSGLVASSDGGATWQELSPPG